MPFSSAVVYARIKIFATGETIDLWQPDYPYLTESSITITRGSFSEIKVTLSIPYDEFVYLVDVKNPNIFDVGNILSVRFGYELQGIYTPWYHGMIFDPDVSIDANMCSVTLIGKTEGQMKRTSGVKSWTNKTAKEIVEELFKKQGFEIEFRGSDTTKKYSTKIPVLEQGGSTDWEVAKSIIDQRGSSFWLGTNKDGIATAFISSYKEENSKVPVRRFVLRSVFDTEKSQYPLLSFTSDSKTSWLPVVSSGIVSHDIDKSTKEINTISVDSNTSSVPNPMPKELFGKGIQTGRKDRESGLIQNKGIDEKKGESVAVVSIPRGTNDSLIQDNMQAAYDASRGLAGTKATGSTIGNPYVLPQDLVQISGVTKRFEGVYRINQVDHNFSSGKWDTTLDMTCEGFCDAIDFAKLAVSTTGKTESKDLPETS